MFISKVAWELKGEKVNFSWELSGVMVRET